VLADRCAVRVDVLGADIPSPHYVALSVPDWLVLRSVRLPDGTPAATAGAVVRLCSSAVHAGEVRPHELWEELTVRAFVTLDGYEPLELTWTPRDRDAPPSHVLQPLATTD